MKRLELARCEADELVNFWRSMGNPVTEGFSDECKTFARVAALTMRMKLKLIAEMTEDQVEKQLNEYRGTHDKNTAGQNQG